MNTRNLGGSLWLLLFGTAIVLLIGAFARFDTNSTRETEDNSAAPAAVAMVDAPTNEAPAPVKPPVGPTLPADLSPGLADVIKLAQAHVGDDTILSYIQNSGVAYSPSADELLYLSDIGVSQSVLAALVKKPAAELASAAAATNALAPAAAPAPASGALAGPPENMLNVPLPTDDQPAPVAVPQNNYFYDSLAPYGSWQETGDGYAWQPTVAVVDPGWSPYVNRGQWLWTDDGWYWASDYSWGWAPFHYGRWSHNPNLGWLWMPGNVWGPAWVAWRNTDGFAGWAALPPGVLFRPGVGLFAVSSLPGLDLSFGISADWFTFVPNGQFLSRNLGRYATRGQRAAGLFASSKAVNNYTVAGGRILNAGVSVEKIAAVSKTPVRKMAIAEVSSASEAGAIGGSAKSLAVYRPVVGAAANSAVTTTTSKPLLINGARPAPERTAEAPKPSFNSGARQSGFLAESLAPAPPRPAPSFTEAEPMAAARPATYWNGDAKDVAIPREPAPAVNYPSFGAPQQGYEAGPSYGSGFRQPSPPSLPQRPTPAAGFGGTGGYGTVRDAAPYNAAAPSRNGGGGSGGGQASAAGSSASGSKQNTK